MIKNIIFLMLLSVQVYGQLRQTERFEIEVKRSDEGYTIVPVDSIGLFLLQETSDYEGKDKKWNIIFLDKELKKQRNDILYINGKYQWIGYENSGPYLYLLFRKNEFSKSDLYVIQLQIDNGDIKTYDITNEIDFEITHFTVCKNSAVMGGYVKQRPTLILYNFDTEQVKAVPNYYLKDAELLDITTNINNTFNVLISNEQNAQQKHLELKVFDHEGGQLAHDMFKIPEGKNVLSGFTSRLKNENLMVTGLFGPTGSKLSEGIFVATADLSKEQTLKLIPLTNLTSLYEYVSPKRREKLWEKANRKVESNEFFERDHVYMHQMLEGDEKYYILLEFFDPNTVRSNQITSPYAVGRRLDPLYFSRYYPNMASPMFTDEYVNIEYEQAMVAALDAQGNVIWDMALKVDDKESTAMEQISDFTLNKDKIALAYKQEDELIWKFRDYKKDVVADSTVQIMTKEASDELKNDVEGEGGVKYWYDGTMFAWGYQTIKKATPENNERLYVFYVNKLETE